MDNIRFNNLKNAETVNLQMQIAQCTLKENKMIKTTYKFLETRENQEMEIKRRGKYYILYAEQQRVHKTIFITNYAIKERKNIFKF